MEDGEPCVGIFPHLHTCLDIMGAHAALRQLQPQPFVGHRVVAAHHTLFLDAQCLAQEFAISGHEGLFGERRRLGETGIVARQINLTDPSVRRIDIAQAGVFELFDQPVLQRPEHALAAAARLRRVGRDVLDADPIERTADLGQVNLVDRLAGLVGVKVVAGAVGIEGSP